MGILEGAFGELKQSGKNLIDAKNAGDFAWKLALQEPLRLVGAGIGSIMSWTLGKLSTLLGGTVKLTGKALANIPIVPGPRH